MRNLEDKKITKIQNKQTSILIRKGSKP